MRSDGTKARRNGDFMDRFDEIIAKYRMVYDHHTHTTYSHGKGSIADNVRVAAAKGLKSIAITDHDTLSGEEEKRAAAAAAAKFLEGEHDFRNFCRLEGYEHTTVRRVERARLVRRGRLVVFQIRGDGFLHNMVRIILGNLELAALGKIRPEEIKELLDTENRTRSDGGRTFPACGLWFWKVTYGAPIW